MSPEDQELERQITEVGRAYRAGAPIQPPARLDDAILSAARRAVQRPRRNWQIPASVAAVLVIGVALVTRMREDELPLPSMEAPKQDSARRTEDKADKPSMEMPGTVAELARPAPPAFKAEKSAPPMPAEIEARPSRERSDRPERALVPQQERHLASGGSLSTGKAGAVAEPAKESPASAAPAGTAGAGRQNEMPLSDKNTAESAISAESKRKSDSPAETTTTQQQASSDAVSPVTIGSVREESEFRGPGVPVQVTPEAMTSEKDRVPLAKKQLAAAPGSAEKEIADIEQLLQDGKTALARSRLREFQRQYPDYTLPPRLKTLLVPDSR